MALTAKTGLRSTLRHKGLREISDLPRSHTLLPKLSLPTRCQADNTDLARMPRASPYRHSGRVKSALC